MHKNRLLVGSAGLFLGFMLLIFSTLEVDAQVVNQSIEHAVITDSTSTTVPSFGSDVRVRTRSSGLYQRSPNGVYWRSEWGYRDLLASPRLPTYRVITSSGRRYVTRSGGIRWVEEPISHRTSKDSGSVDIR